MDALAGSPPDARPLVWLPFDRAPLEPLPVGLRVLTHDPLDGPPPQADDVEFLVIESPVHAPVQSLVPRLPRLRVVQTVSAGVDSLAGTLPPEITLCNGKGLHDAATAELAVALALAAQRDLPGFARSQAIGDWAPARTAGLAGKRVLILGHGSVGAAVEARLSGFEVDVVRVARTAREGVHGIHDLAGLLPTVDVVIVVVPLTHRTRGLVDASFLARMRRGALLVNLARGPVAVTVDLVDACRAGRIRAALDVTDPEPLPSDHPLWHTPGVLVTPHVGGLSDAMWPRVHAFLRAQLRRFADGLPLANVVRGDY